MKYFVKAVFNKLKGGIIDSLKLSIILIPYFIIRIYLSYSGEFNKLSTEQRLGLIIFSIFISFAFHFLYDSIKTEMERLKAEDEKLKEISA